MEIVFRKRTQKFNGEAVEQQESELDLSGVESITAAVLALALAGGVYISTYDIAEQLKASNKVDLAASATQKNPVRKRLDFDQIAARTRDLAAVTDFVPGAEREVTGEDILYLVEAHGGVAIVERDPVTGVIDSITASYTTEYDPAEMQEVLDSLHATGGTPAPTKLVGDLAQTTIVNGSNQEQVLCLAEWSISWKRKTVEATSTDDALYESSLGSSKSWTAKAKYMFLQGDQSQVDGITSAISTTALAALVWTFVPQVGLGLTAFQGAAFIDGIDIASGTGKIVGLDVSLKGTGPLTLKTQIAPITNANTVTGLTAQV